MQPQGTEIAASSEKDSVTNAYYQAFVAALVICLCPFKPLAYAAPLVAACIFLFKSHNRLIRKRTFRCAAISLGVVFVYWLFTPHYFFTGGILAIITYSTLLFLAIVPPQLIAQEDLLDRMTTVIGKVLIFEAIIGIVQACVSAARSGGFDLANGDAVQGTIHLSFSSDEAFSGPILSANLVFFLFALLPVLTTKKRPPYLAAILGVVVVILASVLHQILFAATGLVIALGLFRPSLPWKARRLRLVALAFMVPVLAYAALAENLRTVNYQAGMFAAGDLPKAVMVARTLFDMPHDYPQMPFVGLGPGQFSSRAALIATGLYFGGIEDPKSVPLVRTNMPAAVSDYLLDLWVASTDQKAYGGSSSAKPFFSWLSVYTEFGAPALVAVFAGGFVVLMRMKKRAESAREKWLAVAAGGAICFFLLLGFQENYWEVPQAILVGLMLVQTMYAIVLYGSRKNVARAREAL